MSKKLAIVGGTGAVGRVFIEYLKTHQLPIEEIKIVASKRSAGKKIDLNGSSIVVENIENFDFSSVNYAFFSAGTEVARKYAHLAKSCGCTVIDNSSCFRREESIPLIIPEVNGEILDTLKLPEIISNPNCSVSQLLIALKPIHDLYKIKRVDVATYQSVSGTGKDAIDELTKQSKDYLDNKNIFQCESSVISYSTSQISLSTSSGFEGANIKTIFQLYCSSIAKDQNGMERDYCFESRVFFKDLPSAEYIGNLASNRASKKLNPKKPPTGKFPVIFDEFLNQI